MPAIVLSSRDDANMLEPCVGIPIDSLRSQCSQGFACVFSVMVGGFVV
jgi:hypothetical protein